MIAIADGPGFLALLLFQVTTMKFLNSTNGVNVPHCQRSAREQWRIRMGLDAVAPQGLVGLLEGSSANMEVYADAVSAAHLPERDRQWRLRDPKGFGTISRRRDGQVITLKEEFEYDAIMAAGASIFGNYSQGEALISVTDTPKQNGLSNPSKRDTVKVQILRMVLRTVVIYCAPTSTALLTHSWLSLLPFSPRRRLRVGMSELAQTCVWHG